MGDSDDDMGTDSRFEEDEVKVHRWEYYRFEIVFINATITKLGIIQYLHSGVSTVNNGLYTTWADAVSFQTREFSRVVRG